MAKKPTASNPPNVTILQNGQPQKHYTPEDYSVGKAHLNYAKTIAASPNTDMQSEIIEAAQVYAGAPITKPEFTKAEQDIFDVLREAARRMTGDEIRKALAEKFGESSTSIDTILSYLRRFGFLTNTKAMDARGKGYGLREWEQS